jgi:hypothetical protein
LGSYTNPTPEGALDGRVIGVHTAQVTPRHAIERVTPSEVSLLEQTGHLPAMPAEYAVDRGLLGFRQPTIIEGAGITWLLASRSGQPKKITGVLGFQDRYDFHSCSDIKEICYVNGSKRAVVELVRYCRDEARAEGRRLLGSIDCKNKPMAEILVRMGAAPTRITFEDRA